MTNASDGTDEEGRTGGCNTEVGEKAETIHAHGIARDDMHDSPAHSLMSITKDIVNRIQQSFEFSVPDELFFLPYDKLRQTITPEVVSSLLREALPNHDDLYIAHLTTQIMGRDYSQRGRRNPPRQRIFGILIMMERIDLIQDFVEGGITDDDLPLKLKRAKYNSPIPQLCKQRRGQHHGSDEDSEPLMSLASWSYRDMDYFATRQNAFCVPVFQLSCEENQFYDLGNRPILPFVEVSQSLSGGYGTVKKVRIHRAHYSHSDGCKVKDNPDAYFAVKELHSTTESAYVEEMNFFKHVEARKNGRGSDHLVKLQFSYLYGDRYFLVFPWADGNLREFWRMNRSFRSGERDDVLWFLNQCRGVVGGVQNIHSPADHSNAPKPGAKPRARVHHGGIKPENILWFKDYEGVKDYLVVSDFGLTKFNTAQSRSKINPDVIAGFSGTYRPPEVDLRDPISRRYDIWSLGCVFLEFVSWFILGDTETQESFTTLRLEDEKGDRVQEDKFFILEPSSNHALPSQARLKPSVASWIVKLQEHEDCTEALREFLRIIEHEMLNPAPEERADCERIMTEMTILLNMCRSEPIYDARGQDGAHSPVKSDSGSDTSYAASVWSNLSALTSSSSVVPDLDISEELARVLLRDDQVRNSFGKALQAYDENTFVHKTNRILMKFLVDMRRGTSSDLYLRILRTLAKLERRREVTNSIVRMVNPTNRRDSRVLQFQGSEQKIERLQEELRKADARLSEHKTRKEDVTEDQQPLLDVSDESDNSQDSHAEVLESTEKNTASIEQVEDYLCSGQPFQTLKARLEYLANPPKSIAEALNAESSGVLAVLLERRFLQTATGDYEWLVDLKEMGYTYVEMAKLLYQASHDSPWIYFEPEHLLTSRLAPSMPKQGHHLEGCIHNLLNGDGAIRPDSDVSSLLIDESDIKRRIEELCGLCGITPTSRNETEWNGSVKFRMDQEPPSVTISYAVAQDGVDDIQGPALRILRILRNLQAAAALMQDASFCCQSFTILTTTEADMKSNAPKVSLRRFEFSVLNELTEGLKRLQQSIDNEVDRMADLEKVSWYLTIMSKHILGDLFKLPEVSKPETKSGILHGTIQLIALSVQVLGLGLLLYSQAHTGEFQPFFLDTPFREIRLVGMNSPLSKPTDFNSSIKVYPTQLTCLHDMVGDKVMAFYPSATKPLAEARLDMSGKIEDILDTWGPGQIIFQKKDRSLPMAVRIGGGFITRCIKEVAGRTYHWEHELKLPGNPLTLDLHHAVVIGALIANVASCTNNEGLCWQGSFDLGQMCIIGTHDPHMATSSHEFGMQLGYEGALVTYTCVRQKQPGVTAKEKLFGSGPLRSNSLLGILDHHWAVRMSYCTGVAQRICLRHMIGDLFPVFAETCNTLEDRKIWSSLKGHVVERFSGSTADRQSLKGWLQSLDKDSHNFVLWISNMILNHVMGAGITPDRKSFQVAWPHDDRLHLGIQVPINNEFTKWVPILAESKDCATFAYVTNVCLTTDKISCRGLHPELMQKLLLLETTVMSHHATKIPLQWALCHRKDYYFLVDKSPCWVTVEKDTSQITTPATLIRRRRLETLGPSLKSRVMQTMNQAEQRIREANLPTSQAETVHIVSRKIN